MNRVSLNPRVPVAQQVNTFNIFSVNHGPGVSVNYVLFALSRLLTPLRLQSMATLKEANQLQMWEFIRI